MDPINFLKDDVVDLPKTRSGDFMPFMDDLFKAYIAHVQRVDRRSLLGKVIATRLSRITATCTLLMKALNLAIGSDHDGAYAELDLALTGLGPHFDLLCPKGDMSGFVNPMYRFRNSGVDPYQRHQLFHIPFQSLHLVGQMRYSFSRLPCLYLGGSTNVCWRELGDPSIA